jgi:hypothetical protein
LLVIFKPFLLPNLLDQAFYPLVHYSLPVTAAADAGAAALAAAAVGFEPLNLGLSAD